MPGDSTKHLSTTAWPSLRPCVERISQEVCQRNYHFFYRTLSFASFAFKLRPTLLEVLVRYSNSFLTRSREGTEKSRQNDSTKHLSTTAWPSLRLSVDWVFIRSLPFELTLF